MSFLVEWSSEAIEELMESSIRALSISEQDIVSASLQLEATLRDDPLKAGESRINDTMRVVFEWPIVVAFQIDLRLRMVEILSASVLSSRNDRS